MTVPGKEDGCDDDDAPIVAIQKMNDMIKALTETIDKPMTDPSQRSTFHIQKEIYDAVELDFPDDDTVGEDNTTQDVSKYKSLRMTMMFKIPGKEDGCDDDDAPIVAIQKMNDMIKALTNKLPCFVGPWKTNNAYGSIK